MRPFEDAGAVLVLPDQAFPESNERATWHGKRPRRLLRLILRGR
jgi:hypothetical protein